MRQTGMPRGFQKLTLCARTRTRAQVLKDALTCGYYNLCGGDVVELGLRERGGVGSGGGKK